MDQFLREGEFRAWAGSIDQTLREIRSEQKDHGETLAMLVEAKRISDEIRTDRRKMMYAIVSSVAGSLLALVTTAWHILTQKQ